MYPCSLSNTQLCGNRTIRHNGEFLFSLLIRVHKFPVSKPPRKTAIDPLLQDLPRRAG